MEQLPRSIKPLSKSGLDLFVPLGVPIPIFSSHYILFGVKIDTFLYISKEDPTFRPRKTAYLRMKPPKVSSRPRKRALLRMRADRKRKRQPSGCRIFRLVDYYDKLSNQSFIEGLLQIQSLADILVRKQGMEWQAHSPTKPVGSSIIFQRTGAGAYFCIRNQNRKQHETHSPHHSLYRHPCYGLFSIGWKRKRNHEIRMELWIDAGLLLQ